MNNSFISIVYVIQHRQDMERLRLALEGLYPVLSQSFTDYEIILVNNTTGIQADEYILSLPAAIRQNIFLLQLSVPVNHNHAIVAGLDRSNGDYTILFEPDFYQQPELVLALYDKAVQGTDIVYLRAKNRDTSLRFRPLYKLFYWIMKRYSNLKVDELAHDSRIISRRALNSLLRLRENLQYMKPIYSLVGYKSDFIEVDQPLRHENDSFTERFRTSLTAITSFTTFLRTLLLWIFLLSIAFMLVVTINAVKVKMTHVDLFGTHHEEVPGWTFLVVINSVFFAITCLMLYIMSIYLSNIYQEIKHRPMYIIESVRRF